MSILRGNDFWLKAAIDNMLCAVEMEDPKPTRQQLLSLRGPTREENEEAFRHLVGSGSIFEEDGRYYIAPEGLERFLEITGGMRLVSGPDGLQRYRRC